MTLIPGFLISLITFPGVIIHELAHFLFCRILGIPVYAVCYFRLGNPAGYVIHAKPARWDHQILIGCGPFFINSVLGAILVFPSVLRVLEFGNSESAIDLILIWLGVSVAMHAIPSTGDAESMWSAIKTNQGFWLAKLAMVPVIMSIYILSLGSIIWLDLIYGVWACAFLPHVLVSVFA